MKMLRTLLVALALASPPALAVEAGQLAPSFSLASTSGEIVSLDTLRGKVVLVDFWASWCGPCKRSFPWMAEMQRRYGSRGLAIVAVNVDKKRSDADRFLQAVPAPFTVVFDAAGSVPAAFGVPGMPTSYLIDASGRIAHVEQGFRDDPGALEERIKLLLGKGA
jgi:peroxiredoxin